MMLFIFYLFILGIFSNIELARGNLARDREFPHNVALVYFKRNWKGKLKRRHYCGGVLINSRTVLTAGHCTTGRDRIEVVLGTNDISSLNNGISVGVVNRTLHKKYKPWCFMEYDIGLLFLERDVFENGNSIRYADIDPSRRIPLNTQVTLPGWGENENKEIVEYLHRIQVPVQPIELCNATVDFTGCADISNDEIHICAGDGLREACSGDSGAGLVRLRNGVNSQRWSVVGISSFSGIINPISKENVLGLSCGRGYSGFTRIYPYIDWIWKHAKKPEYKNLEPLEYIDETKNQKYCFGVGDENPSVCSGYGDCKSLDFCDCGHADNLLERDDDCKIRSYSPIISLLGLIVIVIFLFLSLVVCKIFCE